MDSRVPVELSSTEERGFSNTDIKRSLATLANALPVMAWMLDAQGKMVFSNTQWYQYTGLSEAETLEHAWMDALHPDDMAVCQKAWLDTQNGNHPFHAEVRYRRHDGQYRWFLVQAQAIQNNQGEIDGWYGTCTDIHDHRDEEEQLRTRLKREQLIRKVVELTSQSFDIDQILKTVAQEVGQYLDADRCSVNRFSVADGKLLLNLSAQYWREGCKPIDPEDLELIINAVKHLNLETLAEDREQVINMPNQEQYIQYVKTQLESIPSLSSSTILQFIDLIFKYEIRSSLRINISYRGSLYGSISLHQCRNAREWKPEEVSLLMAIAEQTGGAIYQAELYQKAQETAEKALQAQQALEIYAQKLETSNQELEQFATIASHDLQEPLRKIQLFSEMIDRANAEESKLYIERMKNAAKRMQTLINDLLTLSQVQRKGHPFKNVDLNQVLKTVLDDMQIALQETQANIYLEPLSLVQGDEGQIHQLFQNLIGNALKYHQEKLKPCIKIYGQLTEDGHYYQTTVEDNGIGIKPEYIQQIFEPFQRLHSLTKYPGTGIGLTICKKIIERHRGQITVESTPALGSKFHFTLPTCDTGINAP